MKNKKMVFIAHPISGDIEGNIKKVLRICELVHRNGDIPIAPYLVSLQYLNDDILEDRELGIEANIIFFKKKYIDEVYLFGDRISSGMKDEIELAHELDIPVIPKTPETEKEYKRLYRRETPAMKIFLKGVALLLTLISFSTFIWGVINLSIILCIISATAIIGNFFLQIYIDHGVINLTNIKRDFMFIIQRIQKIIGGPPTPIQVKSVDNLTMIIRKEQCKKISIYARSKYLAIAQISSLNDKEYKLDFYITIENKKRIIYSLLLFKQTENTRTSKGMEANLKVEKELQQEGYKIMKIIKNILPKIPVKLFDADGDEIEEEPLVQKQLSEEVS